jgi:serine/threonine protein kinase
MNPSKGATPYATDDTPHEGPARQLWNLWRQGRRPDLADFLGRAGELTLLELVALLRIDQRERWLAGERIPAETYLAEHPSLRANPELALDLVYGEYLLREQLGEAPSAEEYAERFPPFAGEFQLQIELHRAVRSDPALDDTPREPGRKGGALTPGLPVVPGYRVLERLGRGGMGVVYKAWQTALKRVVALKMIWGRDPSDPEQRARFRGEAEAVARLRHPNIVQIYEVGEHEGRPYFSLEFVDGGSLDRVLAGIPQPVRLAARLVETVALAIHHAHQQGIVHRDLKPANLLLQNANCKMQIANCHPANLQFAFCNLHFAIPKITDFGLAKILDSRSGEAPTAAQTQTGQVLGSPSYMAPEQAAGRTRDIGPATDVYSLGAILYEMVCGRPPFQGATALDTLEQVRSQEPVPPSRIQPKVPRDLETICLKCLEKDSQRRYASAQELADDLGRFLAGEPIRARPAGMWERGLKWARRRPAVAGLAGALAAAVVGLLGLGTWSYVQINETLDEKTAALNAKEVERQKAVQAQSEANRHRREAVKQRRQALRDRDAARKERDQARRFLGIACLAVDQFYTVVGQDALFHQPHMERLRRQFLQAALRYYEQLARERVDDPQLLTEQARSYMRYAQVTAQVESVPRALAVAGRGCDQFERLHRQYPDHAEITHGLAMAQSQRADLLCDLVRPQEAHAGYGRAIGLMDGLTGTHPGRQDFQHTLASAYHNRGLLLVMLGKFAEAEPAYVKALTLKKELAGFQNGDATPNNQESRPRFGTSPKDAAVLYQRSLALTLVELAALYQMTGRVGKAEAPCRQGRTIYLRLARTSPGNTRYQLDLGRASVALANIHLALDQADKARSGLVEARKIFERLVKAHPTVAEYRKGLAVAENNLGAVNHAAGELSRAEAAYRQASLEFGRLAFANPAVAEYTIYLAQSTERLGAVLRDRGKLAESLGRYDRAVQIAEGVARAGGRDRRADQLLWRAYTGRAESLNRQGRHGAALADLDRALPASPLPFRDAVRLQRAGTLARLGKHGEAAAEAEAVAGQASAGPDIPYCLACVHALCAEAVLRDKGLEDRERQAAAHGNQAMRLLERAHAAGYFRKAAMVEQVKKDPDLEALRRRGDFRELVGRAEREARRR